MNPYLITGPAIISFSGGRTSRYMLKHVIDAHGGTLPADVVVCFANTGKEMPETLDFVLRTEQEYGCPIVWVEYDPEAPFKTRIVNHNMAARDGEPYSALIQKRSFLPNPVMRFCTTELKIRRFATYATKWLGWEHWTSVVGLRDDEPSRVEKLGPRNEAKKDRWFTVAPLAEAGVVKQDVLDWSFAQPFDLGLPVDENGDTIGGNCDLCFLKGRRKIERLIIEKPDRAGWWIEAEAGAALTAKGAAAHFRADRPSYAAIRDHALWVQRMKDERERKRRLAALSNEDDGDCMCTD